MDGISAALFSVARQILSSKVGEGGKVAFSAFSLLHALLLLYAISTGPVEEELLASINLTPKDVTEKAITDVLALLSGDTKLEHAANLFVKGGGAIPSIRDQLWRVFKTEIQPLTSAAEVNKWVSAVTHGKIPTIMDTLNPNVSAVLLSALYFNGDWTMPFSPGDTVNRTFTSLDGISGQRPLMHRNGPMQYAETPGSHIVVLSYDDTNVRAVVQLPKTTGSASLNMSLDEIAGYAFTQALGHASRRSVDLLLPRFRVDTKLDLTAQMRAMGAHRIFESCGTAPTLGRDMYVDEIMQKCVVEVDERGTVAAAATGITMVPTSIYIPQDPVAVHCDRPFLFHLVHGPTTAAPLLLFSAVIL